MAKRKSVRDVKFTTRLTVGEYRNLRTIAKRVRVTPSEVMRRLLRSVA